MPSAELRDHRVDCVRERLKQLQRKGWYVRLFPKDPDPYPNFVIRDFPTDEEVRFEKLSSDQHLSIELRKIAEITPRSSDQLIYIRVLGKVRWEENKREWQFAPARVGRPPVTV
jgi:hypothetical protein